MARGAMITPGSARSPEPGGAHRPRLLTRRALMIRLAFAIVLLAVVAVVAMMLGSDVISPHDLAATLTTPNGESPLHTILFELRLPRIVLAISVGAALATAGALFQALLRNPLAEPYILGISNGCAIGSILGFMFGLSPFLQPLMAFAGGGICVAAVLTIGRGSYGLRSESMLLGGVMVAAVGAALIFLLLHLVGPQLRSAIQWMLGDLSSAPTSIGYASGGLFVLLLGASLVTGDTLNALALGDDEAATLGIDIARTRTLAFVAGSFVIGVTVAFCGAIGFVGLVVPHIIRRIVGPDHRVVVPLSVVGGGLFLLMCDTLARSIMPAVDSTATELPIGAVTALVGAPVFIALLRRGIAREAG